MFLFYFCIVEKNHSKVVLDEMENNFFNANVHVSEQGNVLLTYACKCAT
jgi:hypothetical protein